MIDQAERLRNIIKTREVKSQEFSARVISVSSGKGGVGKTNIAVNLAIALKKHGKRVSIIDADFGLANIEILFGILPKYSLADVLLGSRSMEEIVVSGPLGIKFISGGSGFSELANISDRQMSYVLDNLSFLDQVSDIILIDTGAGISKTVVNFIKASDESIIVTTPEPTSLTDAYAVIKTVKEENINTPNFKIIVNRVDDEQEGSEVFEKLANVSNKFLNVKLSYLGSVPYDSNLVKAVKRQEPVSLCYPNANSTLAINKIGLKLLNLNTNQRKPTGIKTFMKKLVNIFNS